MPQQRRRHRHNRPSPRQHRPGPRRQHEQQHGQHQDAQQERGNAAAQEQLRQQVQGQEQAASNVDAFTKSNLYTAMQRLVETEGWDPEFAASWLGQAVVETGKQNLEELDVVEHGSGAGRGMFQYTGARRGPYDRARSEALMQGQDPNDIHWQIDYALNTDNPAMDLDAMRQGLTDPEQNYSFNPYWGVATGKSPTGQSYGDRYSDANGLMASYGEDRAAGYTRALTGEYTRPGVPHMDRRLDATRRILKAWREALRRRDSQNGGRMAA